jgi:signal peptide peptidase SppA
MKYQTLLEELNGAPLALAPERLNALYNHLALHVRRGTFDEVNVAELRDVLGLSDAVRANPRAPGNVAVIPIIGMIQPREDIWTRFGLARSSEAIVREARAAATDPSVKAIVFDVDSPGGYAVGNEEASAALFALRGTKPMVAVSNGLNCSAAYFLSSAADEVVGSPSSWTGSIGTWQMHVDQTGMLEQLGVKITLLSAGKYKVSGNPFEPLTADAAARLQGKVDDHYNSFVAAVARNRGASVADVRGGYGEGDYLPAKAALAANLIDRIATMEQTLARFGAVAAATAVPARQAMDQRDREIELAGIDNKR